MTSLHQVHIDTPFGEPSDNITVGKLNGAGVAFLPRHGPVIKSCLQISSPCQYLSLKYLGVEHIIAINSCGSYKEELKPGELLIPDQIVDRTQRRQSTFFGDGCSSPYCLLGTILQTTQ